ncbi:MAG: RteC domain-containing protein [Cyclobacteriaceae bacterium]|nr:RteC domain-containing protein [Cyclobacteriaceae bacterium]
MLKNETLYRLLEELNEQLSSINVETKEPIQKAELCVAAVQKSLVELKQFVLTHKFPSQEKEICFFKEVKPKFFSKLIYYVKVYNIEANKPNGSEKAKKKYLQKELKNLVRYFNRNLDFIKYYRAQKTYLDHKYFVRGNHDLSLSLDSFYFETDQKFSTSHDFKVSKIMANELLEIYLKAEIDAIDKKDTGVTKTITAPKVKLTWTLTKASMIELIYALQSIGAFNHTNSSVKDIVAYFEVVFNTDLSHFYTTFQEIKERKGNQAMFLKSMQDSLIRRINEKEDNS